MIMEIGKVLSHLENYLNTHFISLYYLHLFQGYLWITSLFFRLYKLYFILIKPDMRKQAQNPNWMYFRLAIIYSPCFLICVIGLGRLFRRRKKKKSFKGTQRDAKRDNSIYIYIYISLLSS